MLRVRIKRLLVTLLQIPFCYRIAHFISGALNESIRQRELTLAISLFPKHPRRVMYGPFKGLCYEPESLTSIEFARKLLGTYECELHSLFRSIAHIPYDRVVDIGTAEGYYAIGLMKLIPGCIVYGFEIDDARRALCMANAHANGVVNRLHLQGACSHDTLREVLEGAQRPLIVADCSGHELTLLLMDRIPQLTHADVLIELHEFNTDGPTVAETVRTRFSATHEITFINLRPRKPLSHLGCVHADSRLIEGIVQEHRLYSVGWAFMSSRAAALMPVDARPTVNYATSND